MILTYKKCIDSGWRPSVSAPIEPLKLIELEKKIVMTELHAACHPNVIDMNAIFPAVWRKDFNLFSRSKLTFTDWQTNRRDFLQIFLDIAREIQW